MYLFLHANVDCSPYTNGKTQGNCPSGYSCQSEGNCAQNGNIILGYIWQCLFSNVLQVVIFNFVFLFFSSNNYIS